MAGVDHSPSLTFCLFNPSIGIPPSAERSELLIRGRAEDSPQSKSTPRQSNGRRASRPCFTRVRTGCLTCRRRKKKCNEEKPCCSGCRRNHEVCAWPKPVLGAETVAPDSGDGPRSGAPLRLDAVETSDEFLVDMNELDLTPSSAPRPSAPATGLGRTINLPPACSYTRTSELLFKHYLEVTGPILACVPVQKSPFLTHVVPLAWTDDLLMHSVLALSGAHLSCNRAFGNDVRTASWKHYSALLQGVRMSLSNNSKNNAKRAVELLLVLILLCHYEIISGDLKGNLFHHLHASRKLITSLLTTPNQLMHLGSNNVSLGLCLELYAYILITNSLKPQGIGPGLTLHYDPFVMCLSNLGAYATFGTMFGYCHGLLELIPQITLFASERLAEEEAGLALPSYNLCENYAVIKDKIDTWRLPETFIGDEHDHQMATSASKAFCSSLHIYLATAMAGSLVSDSETRATIQLNIDAIMSAVREFGESPWATISLWPLTIAGSCMTNTTQRKRLVHQLRTSRFRMGHVFAVCKVLELLWETDDPRAFGPYGLFLMERKGFYVPLL